MISQSASAVLVIGGGVAGSSCALMLARAGVAVDLVEKADFPRYKVCGCCIGPAGLAMLDQLSLRQQVETVSLPTDRWLGSFDGRQVELTIPKGIAVSREHLDPVLISAAQTAGVHVAMGVSAKIIASDNHAVTIQRSDRPGMHVGYQAVVVAAGLNAPGLNSFLPWQQTPHGPFGAACTIDGSTSNRIQPGTIYMACDDEGYVGVVRLRDDVIDVAAALHMNTHVKNESATPITPLQRMQHILSRSGFDFPPLQPTSPVLTTAMLRRARLAGSNRLVAIGDAAGYVEPFTGEGMTWAMQSGIAAANLISKTQIDETLGSRWQTEVDQLLSHKKRVCRLVTNGCRNQFIRKAAGIALSRIPKPIVSLLAAPLLKTINHTSSPPRHITNR